MGIPFIAGSQNSDRLRENVRRFLRLRDLARMHVRPGAPVPLVILCMLAISLAACSASRTTTNVPAPQSLSGTLTGVPATSPIDVEGWVKPKLGWLYVLDPQPNPHGFAGRIWLLDPDTARVMGDISTGADPDFALSPDGTRLYVVSDGGNRESNVAVIDTSTGTVIARTTVENRVVASGLPPYSTMAISGDGLALRILVNSPTSAITDGFRLASYDARSGALLPGVIHLGNCGYGRFIDYPTAGQFDFLCPTTNRIRHISVDSESRELDNSFVVLPWVRRLGVAQAFLAPGNQNMTIVRGDGAVYRMDMATATFAATPLQAGVQGKILPAVWPTSPDGGRLYVGYSHYPDPRFYLDYGRSAILNPRTQTVNEIRIFNTSTWRSAGIIKTSASFFWTAVTSNDGKLLYALEPTDHSVVVIDTTNLHQLRSISVGGTPALALVAP